MKQKWAKRSPILFLLSVFFLLGAKADPKNSVELKKGLCRFGSWQFQVPKNWLLGTPPSPKAIWLTSPSAKEVLEVKPLPPSPWYKERYLLRELGERLQRKYKSHPKSQEVELKITGSPKEPYAILLKVKLKNKLYLYQYFLFQQKGTLLFTLRGKSEKNLTRLLDKLVHSVQWVEKGKKHARKKVQKEKEKPKKQRREG